MEELTIARVNVISRGLLVRQDIGPGTNIVYVYEHFKHFVPCNTTVQTVQNNDLAVSRQYMLRVTFLNELLTSAKATNELEYNQYELVNNFHLGRLTLCQPIAVRTKLIESTLSTLLIHIHTDMLLIITKIIIKH